MSVRHIMVRTAVLVAVLLLGDVASLLWPTPDANIGLGLLVFGVLFAVAAVLGVLDGARLQARGGSVSAGWLVIAVAVGVVGAVKISVLDFWYGGGWSRGVLLADLQVAWGLASLVAVPALVGAAIGGRTRPGRRVRR